MPTATVTSKGQVTIPKAIRDALGIKPGDRIVFVRESSGRVVVELETVDVRSLRGIVEYDGPSVTVDEMDAAIAEGASS